ncbi:DUF4221 domain-containing protein [Chitinophaga agrisoli]|uniref:DUF4221 domain-containing protein n=1 Tax=Chitinophaga agrisoli TaxID=2607653 RepID=A0A5B2VP67_9BACT|nr:DUF4221 family protein [Chitinophaga agrisoli]KAA2240176.1 DUF4221 domain-containing protein [Chitinophaga agrisoli]
MKSCLLKFVCQHSYKIGLFIWVTLMGCYSGNEAQLPPPSHIPLSARYQLAGVAVTTDTIKLPIDSLTESKFSCFNFKQLGTQSVFAFFDKNTFLLNIYDLHRKECIKRLNIKEIAKDYRPLLRTKVYFKSYDSIYVYSNMNLYRIDTNGTVKDSIGLLFDPYRASSSFQNTSPPVFVDNQLVLPASPTLDCTNKGDLQKWRLVYRIEWNISKASLLYKLPEWSLDSMYDKQFLAPSYCYNPLSKQFVFSFAPDSNIYVTDLVKTHYSYSCRSQGVSKNMPSFTLEDIKDGESSYKAFLKRDSYGPVYFDPYMKRYLRVAEKKINGLEYSDKQLIKEHSILIMDSSFRVIGESIVDKNINLYSLIFTPNGMYARADSTRSEDTIYLVKLDYEDLADKVLTKK